MSTNPSTLLGFPFAPIRDIEIKTIAYFPNGNVRVDVKRLLDSRSFLFAPMEKLEDCQDYILQEMT